jgi:hypothetical protein
MVGGAVGADSTRTSESRFLNLRDNENWDADPTSTRPTARRRHSAVYWNGFTVIFGGDIPVA